jgi:hypothetical protein
MMNMLLLLLLLLSTERENCDLVELDQGHLTKLLVVSEEEEV